MIRQFGFAVSGVGAWAFVVALISPARADDARVRGVSAKTVARASDADERAAGAELRRSLRQVLSQPFPAAAADVQRRARDFIALYRRTAQSPLSASERGRWQARLRRRLIGLRKAIARELENAPSSSRAATRDHSTDAANASESRSASRGGNGGAPRSNAQDLIDLIQNTIAPESWDVNGGRGTIVYWEPGFALVVRQTEGVHEEIGGVLRGLGN